MLVRLLDPLPPSKSKVPLYSFGCFGTNSLYDQAGIELRKANY